MNKTLGSTLITSGTMIGAGMLAMPLTSAGIGFTFTVVLLILLWILLTYSALLFVEVYQTAEHDAGIGTLAAQYFGRPGRIVATSVLMIFLYALLSAYVTGGGAILASMDYERGNQANGCLDRFFKLTKHGTSVKTEIFAGITMFIASVYILAVIPNLLSVSGMPHGSAVAAVILTTAFATMLIGFVANVPVIVAPGLGLSAFFSYTICGAMGLSWQTALGAVFISGTVFVILTVTKVLNKIVDGIPQVLKTSIGVGIGLFVAFIGFKNAHIIISDNATFVTLGNMKDPAVLLTLLGLFITSILLKNKPDKVKLIMIDPKMVELSIYDGIPHLLTSVVTDPLKAADVLHKVVLEMESRYREFARTRVRNIEGYNKIAEKDPDYKELPYIVVIIDELADLMMVSSKEVEESIARIAQKARAAGIHMIIATQRPSVDVITGVIKTNIPSRIAFAVSSSVDSRTILDKSGAETLLGKGDMLYLSADSSKPVRIQGAFLSDDEVEKVVDFVKSQSEAQYDPNMTPSEVSSQSGGSSADEADPLYKEVLLFIAKTQKASASLLQRRFKIGYNRAARIIDMLEEDGYIGPVDGSKPRKVFLEKEFAEDYE